MHNIKEDHPINVLYFRISSEVTEVIEVAFDKMLDDLANNYIWTISPPDGMDYFEQREWDEEPVRIYGCALDLYSAFPPWGDKLPKEVDLQHFNEVNLLIDRVSQIAREQKCSFEVQLDANDMGEITPTEVSVGITETFLGEWKKLLGANS